MPVSDLDIARPAHVFIQHGTLGSTSRHPALGSDASTLAFADAFRAIMLAFVLATLLVLLLRNVSVRPATNSANGTRSGGMAR